MATTYTITFNANGGTGAPASITFLHGDSVKIPSTTPTRDGYTFEGWGDNSNSTTAAYHSGDIILKYSNCTLYAVWVAESSSTADGSSFSKAIPISLDTEVNVEMPNGVADLYYKFTPPEDGDYIFESYNNGSIDPHISLYNSSDTNNAIGSNDDIDGSNNRNFKLTQSLTSGTVYYLKIHRYAPAAGTFNFSVTKENTYYTIKFDGNGADAGSSVPLDITQKGTSTSVIMGDISSDVPTKTGYIFRGWSSTQEYNKDYRIAYDSVSVGGADSNGVLATTTQSTWTYQDYCTNTGYTGTSTTLTLYAQWEVDTAAATYTLTVKGDLNEADSYSSISPSVGSYSYKAGDTISLSATLKSGYDVLGWVYKKDSDTTWRYIVQNSLTGIYTMPAENVTIALYTQKNTITYTIQFNGNGNTEGNIPSTIIKEGNSTSVTMGDISSVIPIKTGYIFRGWSSTSSYSLKRIAYSTSYGGSADSNGVSATTTQSTWTYQNYCDYTGYTGTSTTLTLYAQWERSTYTITYNKGTYGSGTNTTDTKTHGTTLVLKGAIFTRTGYTQTGWASNEAGTTFAYNLKANYTTNAAITLYPYWAINTYKVSYVDNYGATVPSAQTKTYGIDLTLSSTKPSRTGYTFLGWDTDSSADTVVYQPGATYSTNAAVTLYAVWAVNSYQFTLGKAEHVNTKGSTESGTKNYEEQITLRATVDTGYSFGQWTSSNTSLIDNQTSANTSFPMPAGNITMTPSVTSNQYKIIYDIETNANPRNSLYSKPSETIYSYTGTTNKITITSTEPIQTGGYTFVGWCRTSNSTSDILKPGDLINQSTSDITLYAVWEKNIEITYNINGGSGSTPTKQSTTIYNKNGATFSLASNTGFSREGYEFDGWSTTLNDSSTGVLSDTIFKESATLYALWDIQYYSLTTKIYTNGVESNESGNSVRVSDIESGSSDGNMYAYGSVIKLIATAVDPYDFESWSQDNFDKGPGDISEDRNISEQKFTITKNTVIRANFATGKISACFYCYDITSGSPELWEKSIPSPVNLWVRSKAITESDYGDWEQKSFSTKMTYNDSTRIQVLIENGKKHEFNSGTGINFDYEIPDQLTDILIESEQSFSIPCKELKEENHIYVNNVLKKSGYIKDPYFSQNEPISSIWIGNKQIMGLSPSEVYPYTEDSLLIDTLYVNNQNYFLDNSYQGYTSIKKIIIPKNITTIGANYLSSCTNLKTVKFLQNSELTSLGNQAFAADDHLLKIYLPDKLQNIGIGAFQGCTLLQKIVLPASVSTIQEYAFDNCGSLQSLKLNHTKITELPQFVFMNCSDLKRIFLPKTLTSIDQGAFDQCSSLKKIIYMGTIEDWNKITILPSNTGSEDNITIQCIDGIIYTNLK